MQLSGVGDIETQIPTNKQFGEPFTDILFDFVKKLFPLRKEQSHADNVFSLDCMKIGAISHA